MTAIAGFVATRSAPESHDACAIMAEGQRRFGGDQIGLQGLTRAHFSRNLDIKLPEDIHDRQPLHGRDHCLLFAADVRIDEREMLIDQLEWSGDGVDVSDADILLSAWEKWGERSLDRVRGEYALAVWDADAEQLTLARSPLGAKQLYFYEGEHGFAFASTISGLRSLPSLPVALDFARAASFAAGIHPSGDSSFFRNIRFVEQGNLVSWDGERVKSRRFWSLPRGPSQACSANEHALALREKLDGSVASRLRRATGLIATHLSSGRDSSAVTATAARLLDRGGKCLVALTAAPRLGYDQPVFPGKLADESALAVLTARQHPNVNHVICRPDGSSPFDGLEELHRLSPNPVGHLSNFRWVRQIMDHAQREGATVLLSGQAGNFGLSAGGRSHLVDVMHEDGVGGWWRTARELGGYSLSSWRSILNISIGPFLPRSLHSLLMRVSGRSLNPTDSLELLRPFHRTAVEDVVRREMTDQRPPQSVFDQRREMLFRRDDCSSVALAIWGIDTRDPTADRDLIEYCFALPAKELASRDEERPLFDQAMQDRLPPEVLASTKRGLQGADWHEIFTRDEVAADFQLSSRHPVVRELLDTDHITGLIDRWPTSGWGDRATALYYRNDVLRVVTLANFIRANF